MNANYEKFINAVRSGNAEQVRRICQDDWIEKKDWAERRPIHTACANGYLEIVSILIDKGCQLDPKDKDGCRPIHDASLNGHVAVVRKLIDRGCQLEGEDKGGWRPIHWACMKGHPEVVKLLLRKGCAVTPRTHDNETPLDIAEKYESKDCARIIREAMNADNSKEKVLVHTVEPYNFIVNDDDLVSKTKIKTNEKLRRNMSFTPPPNQKKPVISFKPSASHEIFNAARKNNTTAFQKLFPRYSLDSQEYENGVTLLDTILMSDSKGIIDIIKSSYVQDSDVDDFLNIDETRMSEESFKLLIRCLLYRCIRHGNHFGFLQLCTPKKVNSGFLLDGLSCLEVAVMFRRGAFVQMILQKSVKIDKTWTKAKGIAVKNNFQEIVNIISQRETFIQRKEEMGYSRLHIAVLDGNTDMIDYILSNNLDDVKHGNNKLGTPLNFAVASGNDSCLEIFEQHRVNPNGVNRHNQTVLHLAIENKLEDLPDYFIANSCCLEQYDYTGLTALQQAILSGMEKTTARLLKYGADHRKAISPTGIINVGQSVATSNLRIPLSQRENSATLCLKIHGNLYSCFYDVFNSNDTNFADNSDNTLLHMAAELMLPDACRRLIVKGANVKLKNKFGKVPLNALVSQIYHSGAEITELVLTTIKSLLTGGSTLDEEDSAGETPFRVAMKIRNEKLLSVMIQNSSQTIKVTAEELDEFMEVNPCGVLEELLPKLSKSFLENYITSERLRYNMALSKNNFSKSLFKYAKSDVQQAVIEEFLYKAAQKGDSDYFGFLLRFGVLHPSRFANGETLFTALLKDKNIQFCQYLLKIENSSKLIELKNKENSTPLIISIEFGIDDLIEELIAKSTAVDDENNAGFNALSLLMQQASTATETNLTRLTNFIKTLINKSADIYKVNKNGKKVISFCTVPVVKLELEVYFDERQRLQSNHDTHLPRSPSGDSLILCFLCKIRKVDCCLECGHTLCSECVKKQSRCPCCKSTAMKPRKIFI